MLTTPHALEVVRELVAQRLAARYRRAWIGLAWMLLVPLATMSAMALAVSVVLHMRRGEILPHIVASVLAWQLFNHTVLAASHSLVASQEILRRHAVPRWVFPASAVVESVIEYLVASLMLVVLGPLLGMHVSPALLCAPLGFACLVASATGLGLLGAIGTVHLRDLGPIIQVVMGMLYWASPIIYTRDMAATAMGVAPGWLLLNPLVSMLGLYTEPLVHGRWPALEMVLVAVGVSLALLLAGTLVFSARSRRVVFAL